MWPKLCFCSALSSWFPHWFHVLIPTKDSSCSYTEEECSDMLRRFVLVSGVMVHCASFILVHVVGSEQYTSCPQSWRTGGRSVGPPEFVPQCEGKKSHHKLNRKHWTYFLINQSINQTWSSEYLDFPISCPAFRRKKYIQKNHIFTIET